MMTNAHDNLGLLDAGDPYTGLDRFGRVVDQKWATSTGTAMDEYSYTHDRDSNVTLKRNALQPPTIPAVYGPYDEGYTYDSLNRLTAVSRGTQSTYQSLTLNAIGDISSVTTAGTTSNRTTNADNQITQIGSSTLSYDSNGNLIKNDQGHSLVYDAWNRLTAVYNGSTLLASYTYDGLGRRITANTSTTTDFYFTGQQDIDEYQAGNVTTQTVFSPVHVNAPILRDSGGTRLYFTADANADVTGAFNTSGNATQRMVYDSGGNVAFKTGNWSAGSNSQNLTDLYQGMQYDVTIGWYFTPNRLYSPTMEVWNRPDPLGYIDTMSLYAFVAGNPINSMDPSGLFAVSADIQVWGGLGQSYTVYPLEKSPGTVNIQMKQWDPDWGVSWSVGGEADGKSITLDVPGHARIDPGKAIAETQTTFANDKEYKAAGVPAIAANLKDQPDAQHCVMVRTYMTRVAIERKPVVDPELMSKLIDAIPVPGIDEIPGGEIGLGIIKGLAGDALKAELLHDKEDIVLVLRVSGDGKRFVGAYNLDQWSINTSYVDGWKAPDWHGGYHPGPYYTFQYGSWAHSNVPTGGTASGLLQQPFWESYDG